MTTSDYLEQLVQDKSDMVDNLTAKGISGLTGDETFTELVPEILNIPSGGSTVEEKDVNFYDYDGTLLYSYTAQEFMALSELPANPTHTGLTSQGWNATLAEIQNEVGTHGWFNVGQLYVTDDGKTRIYVDFQITNSNFTSFYLGVGVNGSITINWGDGSTEETVTGTDQYTFKFISHTYSQSGEYMITISGSTYLFGGASSNDGTNVYYGSYLLNYSSSTSRVMADEMYLSKIKKIEIGTGITQFYSAAFRNLSNLESITIPRNITNIGSNVFEYCNSLKCVVSRATVMGQAFNRSAVKYILNYGTTYILSYTDNIYTNKQYIFGNNISNCKQYGKFKEAYISNTVTTLGMNQFSYCPNLEKVHFGKNLTQIYQKIFEQCYSLNELDFRKATRVPTISSTTLFGLSSQCKIVVPDSLYSSWRSANYWSSVSSQIVKASEA